MLLVFTILVAELPPDWQRLIYSVYRASFVSVYLFVYVLLFLFVLRAEYGI